jgi:hypothetical protein
MAASHNERHSTHGTTPTKRVQHIERVTTHVNELLAQIIVLLTQRRLVLQLARNPLDLVPHRVDERLHIAPSLTHTQTSTSTKASGGTARQQPRGQYSAARAPAAPASWTKSPRESPRPTPARRAAPARQALDTPQARVPKRSTRNKRNRGVLARAWKRRNSACSRALRCSALC